MQATKISVRDRVTKLRASIIRREIEHIDCRFKSNDRRRFRVKDHSHSIPIRIRSTSGEVISDQQAVSEEFVRFFSNLSTSTINKNVSSNRISTAHQRSYHPAAIDPLSEEFSIAEILKAVKSLKCGKASGHDNILSEHIKFGGPMLIKWLKKVFNRITALEEIPSCLRVGIITPIYKRKGKDPLDVSSYRGITISSVFAKLYETLILDRMSPIVDILNLPDCLQTAYRKGLSCSDAIFFTQETILSFLNDGGHPLLGMYDLEKAYDSVEHCILLERLLEVGVGGRVWRIIANWYSSSESSIRLPSTVSSSFPVTRGVRQGSVLSPLLFLMVMDSLLKNFRRSNVGLSVSGSFVGGAALQMMFVLLPPPLLFCKNKQKLSINLPPLIPSN